jgi:hypothetical protein
MLDATSLITQEFSSHFAVDVDSNADNIFTWVDVAIWRFKNSASLVVKHHVIW